MVNWIKKYRDILILAGAVILLLTGSVVFNGNKGIGGEPDNIGSVDDGQWLYINSFDGYQTKLDPTKISNGGNPQGQNTTINQGDRISVRNLGYELLPSTGTASTTEEGIESLHTFRRRDGENIMMRSHGTFLEYYEEGNDTWEILVATSTDASYGFADYNVNSDLRSLTYFGNGSDPFSRWSGAHVQIGDAGVTSTAGFIMTDNPIGKGFSDSGDIVYCGQRLAYSAVSATGFEVVSAHACDANRGLAQAVEEYPTNPKGNIYLNANNRLFISGIASTTQAVFFSAYGEATNFVGADLVTTSTADSAGIFNLGEGGGGVVGMVLDENSIYMFKRSLIYKATLSDALYSLTPLKTFDSKSQTTGAVRNQSIFTSGNQVYFITPDNQIMSLGRVESIDAPQVVPISDVIKPTVDIMNFDASAGVVFRDKAYFSVKQNSSTSLNNVVLVWNIKGGFWDSPILGLNASEFTVYDDGTSEELYFSDNATPNVYKVTDTPLDYIFGVTANWRSKQLDFGNPVIQKEIDNIYLEGYIADNTSLTVSMLLDENGFTQSYSTVIAGTESDYLYSADSYNVFGLSPFGTERFGSNDDFSGKKKFRVYLNKDLKRLPFYNAQLEFASDGENQQWEITAIGIHWRFYSQPEKRQLYRNFN